MEIPKEQILQLLQERVPQIKCPKLTSKFPTRSIPNSTAIYCRTWDLIRRS